MPETNPFVLNIGSEVHVLMIYPLVSNAYPIRRGDIPFLSFIYNGDSSVDREKIFKIDTRKIEEIKITADATVVTLGKALNARTSTVSFASVTPNKTPETLTLNTNQFGVTAFTDYKDAEAALTKYTNETIPLTTSDAYHYLTGKTQRYLDKLEFALTTPSEAIKDIMLNNPGKLSDGYHTFNELYDHRAALLVALTHLLPNQSWKSKLHHDGTMYDNMFIVGIDLPDGQISYHYNLDPWWHRFKCKELDRAPEWDGHEPNDVIARLCNIPAYGYDWFSQPKEDK